MPAVAETWKREVTLPVGVSSLQFEADPAVAKRDAGRIDPRGRRVAAGSGLGESRGAARRAAMARCRCSSWTATRGSSRPVSGSPAGRMRSSRVAADQPAPVQLFVRNGPVENAVTLESGAWRESLTLRPGEERLMQLPIDGEPGRRRCGCEAASGFRPVRCRSATARIGGFWECGWKRGRSMNLDLGSVIGIYLAFDPDLPSSRCGSSRISRMT